MKKVLAVLVPLPVVLASESLGAILECAPIRFRVTLQMFSNNWSTR